MEYSQPQRDAALYSGPVDESSMSMPMNRRTASSGGGGSPAYENMPKNQQGGSQAAYQEIDGRAIETVRHRGGTSTGGTAVANSTRTRTSVGTRGTMRAAGSRDKESSSAALELTISQHSIQSVRRVVWAVASIAVLGLVLAIAALGIASSCSSSNAGRINDVTLQSASTFASAEERSTALEATLQTLTAQLEDQASVIAALQYQLSTSTTTTTTTMVTATTTTTVTATTTTFSTPYSCRTILKVNPGSKSGFYDVTLGTSTLTHVYCDMSTKSPLAGDGVGGWTLFLSYWGVRRGNRNEDPRYPGENGNDFDVASNAASDTFKLPLPQLEGGDGMLIGMSGLANPSDGDTNHDCPGVSPGSNGKAFPFVWQWDAGDDRLSGWVNSNVNDGLDSANRDSLSVETAWKSDPDNDHSGYTAQGPLATCHNWGDSGEFETLTVGQGDDCWAAMEWGSIDSSSRCSVGKTVSYSDGTYERIFAFFREPGSYAWEN